MPTTYHSHMPIMNHPYALQQVTPNYLHHNMLMHTYSLPNHCNSSGTVTLWVGLLYQAVPLVLVLMNLNSSSQLWCPQI